VTSLIYLLFPLYKDLAAIHSLSTTLYIFYSSPYHQINKQPWDCSALLTPSRRRRSSLTRVSGNDVVVGGRANTDIPEAKSEEKQLKQALKDVDHAQDAEEKGAKKEHHAQSVNTSGPNSYLKISRLIDSRTRKPPRRWPRPNPPLRRLSTVCTASMTRWTQLMNRVRGRQGKGGTLCQRVRSIRE
jgi:hypothetical protein